MNIEIANRLQQLRKEKGYSQEELAQALGLSRQAVSKWERAESSPDTDNLICLARLYGMSLDELLNTTESTEEIKERTIEVEKEKEENDEKYIKIEKGHICSRGCDSEFLREKKHPVAIIVISSVTALIATILFLVFGFVFNAWKDCWLFFLFIPVIASLAEAIINTHAFTSFAYPVLIVIIYLFLGFEFDLWHPLWILFITIPVFYITFDPIDKYVLKTKRLSDEEKARLNKDKE